MRGGHNQSTGGRQEAVIVGDASQVGVPMNQNCNLTNRRNAIAARYQKSQLENGELPP